jgi:hypothetical protein
MQGRHIFVHQQHSFVVKLEKKAVAFYKYYSKFMKREQWIAHRFQCDTQFQVEREDITDD